MSTTVFLGIDTSNYTTSVALYYPQSGQIVQEKQLLPVKPGEKGIRQSDAVFHHTQILPVLTERLLEARDCSIVGVGVSSRPTTENGSYMPCFTVGLSAARVLCATLGVRKSEFSHQQGHIAAAVYSAGRSDLLEARFIAFHVSGGTTQAVLVEPLGNNKREPLKCTPVASSLDLKAGQAVDRVGVMLGLNFPCGAEIDALACKSDKNYKIRPSMKDGNCSLSGVENRCRAMFLDGEAKEDIARYCIEYIAAALADMTRRLLKEFGSIPLVFSGGVMSNSIVSERFTREFGAVFAEPEFSCDNAAGAAFLASVYA